MLQVLRRRPHASHNPQWRSLAALQRWMRRPRAGPFPRPLPAPRARSESARFTLSCRPHRPGAGAIRPKRRPPKRSGEMPADETHRAATGSSASMPPSTSAPTREFVDSAWATYLRRQATETPSQTRDEASAWTNDLRRETREYWERRRMEQLATVQTSPTEPLSEDMEADALSPSETRLMLWGLMEELELDEEERQAFLEQHAPAPALLFTPSPTSEHTLHLPSPSSPPQAPRARSRSQRR